MTDETVMAFAAVRCHGDSVPGHCCGLVEIDEEEYTRQMSRPDSLWCCPNCGSTADFDDAYFEKSHGIDQEAPAMPAEEYLGDAVYARFDGYQIWLETRDGQGMRIALEPSVYGALKRYAERIWSPR